jgi:hypothetical protein
LSRLFNFPFLLTKNEKANQEPFPSRIPSLNKKIDRSAAWVGEEWTIGLY